jgi:uncharacterized OB-fold protein
MPQAATPEVSNETVFEKFRGVLIDYDNIEHYRGLLQSRLLINRCQDCGYWIYPHYPMCSQCWSVNVEPTEVSGRATVHFWSLLHQPTLQSPEGVSYEKPYPDVGFELAEREDLRYSARLVNCENEDLYIGMPVELTWIEVDGVPAPAFEPAPGARREGKATDG